MFHHVDFLFYFIILHVHMATRPLLFTHFVADKTICNALRIMKRPLFIIYGALRNFYSGKIQSCRPERKRNAYLLQRKQRSKFPTGYDASINNEELFWKTTTSLQRVTKEQHHHFFCSVLTSSTKLIAASSNRKDIESYLLEKITTL